MLPPGSSWNPGRSWPGGCQGQDEALVERELVDGQVLQVAQGAVASAVVVDGDLDIAVAQPGQDRPSSVAAGHEELLGDLQLPGHAPGALGRRA